MIFYESLRLEALHNLFHTELWPYPQKSSDHWPVFSQYRRIDITTVGYKNALCILTYWPPQKYLTNGYNAKVFR